MVDGTYNGADGHLYMLRRRRRECTVTVDDEGCDDRYRPMAWIFTPATGATSDQPDYDYLHYGFWLQKTADADGVLTYNEVQTFAGSSVAASDSVPADWELNAVTGSATYNGGATGVYVHSEVNSDGSPT